MKKARRPHQEPFEDREVERKALEQWTAVPVAIPGLTPGMEIWVYSMGKRFRVTGIFANEADANSYMEKNPGQGCIACCGSVVLVAEAEGVMRRPG